MREIPVAGDWHLPAGVRPAASHWQPRRQCVAAVDLLSLVMRGTATAWQARKATHCKTSAELQNFNFFQFSKYASVFSMHSCIAL